MIRRRLFYVMTYGVSRECVGSNPAPGKMIFFSFSVGLRIAVIAVVVLFYFFLFYFVYVRYMTNIRVIKTVLPLPGWWCCAKGKEHSIHGR